MSVEHDKNKKQRLRNFDFSGENHGMHLVADWQGGAANGESTLMTKATNSLSFTEIAKAADVTVTLSFEDFLTKFFNMWSSDAATLASILGYEIQDEDERWEWKPLDERIAEFSESVTLMKAANAGEELTDEIKYKLIQFQSEIEKSLLSPAKDEVAQVNKSTDIGDNKEMTDKTKTVEISKADHEALVNTANTVVELQKAVETMQKSVDAANKRAEDAEQARVDAENASLKKELTKAASELNLDDELQSDLVDFMFAAREVENAQVVMKALHTVNNKVAETLTDEQGVDTKVADTEVQKSNNASSLLDAVMAMTEDAK